MIGITATWAATDRANRSLILKGRAKTEQMERVK